MTLFSIDYPHHRPRSRIVAALPHFVLGKTPRNIGGDARVERTICALEYIKEVHLLLLPILDYFRTPTIAIQVSDIRNPKTLAALGLSQSQKSTC